MAQHHMQGLLLPFNAALSLLFSKSLQELDILPKQQAYMDSPTPSPSVSSNLEQLKHLFLEIEFK